MAARTSFWSLWCCSKHFGKQRFAPRRRRCCQGRCTPSVDLATVGQQGWSQPPELERDDGIWGLGVGGGGRLTGVVVCGDASVRVWVLVLAHGVEPKAGWGVCVERGCGECVLLVLEMGLEIWSLTAADRYIHRMGQPGSHSPAAAPPARTGGLYACGGASYKMQAQS